MKTLSHLVVLIFLSAASLRAQSRGALLLGYTWEKVTESDSIRQMVREELTNSYDRSGTITKSILSRSQEGIVYEIETSTWRSEDNGKRLTQSTQVDQGADGSVDSLSTTTYIYEKNNLSETIATSDGDRDGVDEGIWTTRYSYDSRGNPTQIIEEFDNLTEPTAVSRTVTTVSNDYRNNIQTRISQKVVADGAMEPAFMSTASTDQRGNPLKEAAVVMVGTFSIYLERQYAYDREGNLIEERLQFQGVGSVGQPTSIQKWVKRYYYGHVGQVRATATKSL